MRRKRGMTLEQVSAKTGSSISTLSRLETGARRLRVDQLEALSKALRCEREDLLASEGIARRDLRPRGRNSRGAVRTGRRAVRNTGPFRDEEGALRAVVDRLATVLLPEAIYLIGSRADGHARPDSDFDLVVVMPDTAGDGGRDYDRAYAPVLGLGVGCDVVPCLRTDFEADRARRGTLANACIIGGRLVYRGDGTFAAAEPKAKPGRRK